VELAERMQKTEPGQVTWASPDLGKKCVECRHIARVHKGYVCKLVRVVSGKIGVPYDASRAIACSKFEGIDTETTKA